MLIRSMVIGFLLVPNWPHAAPAQEISIADSRPVDDKPVRGLVQQLSQAQQMLLGLPDLVAEIQRLQAENKDLKAKLEAKGEK